MSSVRSTCWTWFASWPIIRLRSWVMCSKWSRWSRIASNLKTDLFIFAARPTSPYIPHHQPTPKNIFTLNSLISPYNNISFKLNNVEHPFHSHRPKVPIQDAEDAAENRKQRKRHQDQHRQFRWCGQVPKNQRAIPPQMVRFRKSLPDYLQISGRQEQHQLHHKWRVHLRGSPEGVG